MNFKSIALLKLIALTNILIFHTIPPCFSQENKKVPGKPEREYRRENKAADKRNTIVQVENGNLVLGSPTTNSITANVILGKEGEGFIEYGTASGKYIHKTAVIRSKTGEPAEIIIKELSANTQYFYRLNYKKIGEKEFSHSPESWFATQKKAGTSFSFSVQGDSHPERAGKMFSPALYSQTIDSVSQHKPDFYFMLGDDFSIDRLIEKNEVNKENVEKVYEVQRYYLGNAGKNPPLFLVNGNHEQAAKYLLDGSPNNAAVLAANARKKYFPLPQPGDFYTGDKDTVDHVGLLEDYYSFEWGDALFVVIDPYWHSDSAVDNQPGHPEKKNKRNLWDISLGSAQYQWFKHTLENSRAKFRFVFSHHVLGTGRGGIERASLYEWGGYSQNGDWQFDRQRPGWDLPIHQLMVKNKVTIFFQGHDHIFARQELDGIIYQSVPNPADDTYTAFNRDAYRSGDILPNSGFLHVSVSDKEVKVEYIRSYSQDGSNLPDEAKKTFTYTLK